MGGDERPQDVWISGPEAFAELPRVMLACTHLAKEDAMLRTPEPAVVSTPQTFRTFVTGPSNALAYNVALTVARTPGSVYNPLYLSGGPGLGKSHLLQAIGAYLAPRLHGAEVTVLSATTFPQEFAAHLRQGHMLAFRRRYRRAGALLLDEIARLAGRDAAAEELVHTLDALREAALAALAARVRGSVRDLEAALASLAAEAARGSPATAALAAQVAAQVNRAARQPRGRSEEHT